MMASLNDGWFRGMLAASASSRRASGLRALTAITWLDVQRGTHW
jgi:hypothetical protein